MVTERPATAPAATDPDYEAYQLVVRLVSEGAADVITGVLRNLRDPDDFRAAIGRLADIQGTGRDAVADLETILRSFWKLANGLQVNFCWQNNAGVPFRSTGTGDTIERPEQPGSSPSDVSAALSGFGYGITVQW
ncbi:hypothetical protein LUX01_02640 [Streptomyces sudanensis]|uniref:hypothetical protein n=1 Tax=Streptomyces sudanensis TaxID=436397 RepID=UPI0020CE2E1C|nr:hypothetical protein [Streptomyces sudanensis]MCP9985758.1 hypothetical protein [Streptomyces sudanensis]